MRRINLFGILPRRFVLIAKRAVCVCAILAGTGVAAVLLFSFVKLGLGFFGRLTGPVRVSSTNANPDGTDAQIAGAPGSARASLGGFVGHRLPDQAPVRVSSDWARPGIDGIVGIDPREFSEFVASDVTARVLPELRRAVYPLRYVDDLEFDSGLLPRYISGVRIRGASPFVRTGAPIARTTSSRTSRGRARVETARSVSRSKSTSSTGTGATGAVVPAVQGVNPPSVAAASAQGSSEVETASFSETAIPEVTPTPTPESAVSVGDFEFQPIVDGQLAIIRNGPNGPVPIGISVTDPSAPSVLLEGGSALGAWEEFVGDLFLFSYTPELVGKAVPEGFQFQLINRSSLLLAAGMRSDDVLVSVNGFPAQLLNVDSVPTALADGRVILVISRSGQQMTLQVGRLS